MNRLQAATRSSVRRHRGLIELSSTPQEPEVMRVFVPFPDDFSSMPDLSRIALVPYRPGVALAIEPEPPRGDGAAEVTASGVAPPTARAA
jgi:hypothetical protein